MKKITCFFIAFGFLFLSCDKEDSPSKEAEAQNLIEMYEEIVTASMVNSTPCTNPAEWYFTAIGSKACGGPTGYIAYSLKINTAEFLKKVENYTNAQNDYNKKWSIMSTCVTLPPPSGVDCVNGKATLIYSNTTN